MKNCQVFFTHFLLALVGLYVPQQGICAEDYQTILQQQRAVTYENYINDVSRIETNLETSNDPFEKAVSSIFLSAIYADHNVKLSEIYASSAHDALSPLGDKVTQTLSPYLQYLSALQAERNGDFAGAGVLLNESLIKLQDADLILIYVEKLLTMDAVTHNHDHLLKIYEEFKYPIERHHKFYLMALAASHALTSGNYQKHLEIAIELAKKAPYHAVAMDMLNQLLGSACGQGWNSPSRPFYIPLDFIKAIAAGSSVNNGLMEWAKAALSGPVRMPDHRVRRLSALQKARVLLSFKDMDAVQDLLTVAKNEAIAQGQTGQIEEIEKFYDDAGINNTDSHPKPRSELSKERIANLHIRQGKYYLAALQFGDILKTKKSINLKWKTAWNLIRAEQYQAAEKILSGTTKENIEDHPWRYWRASLSNLNGFEQKNEHAEAESVGSIFDYLLHNRNGNKISFARTKENPLFLDAEYSQDHLAGGKNHAYCDFYGDLGSVGERKIPRAWFNLIGSGCFWSKTNLAGDFTAIETDTATDDLQKRLRKSGRRANYSPQRLALGGPTSIRLSLAGLRSESQKYNSQIINELVARTSRAMGIDESLVKAVIIAESGFNIMARSRVGATGLMQVMPFTSMKIAAEIGDSDYHPENMNVPMENIFYGAYYLQRLLTYYSNHLVATIAAYNAGPYWTNRWIENCRDCREDMFVDSISFKETRDYVKRVMTLYTYFCDKAGTHPLHSPEHRLAKIYFSGPPPY